MTTVENMAGAEQGATRLREDEHIVEVTVEYLPATKSYHHDYPRTTAVEIVRTDAMTFFGVRDRQERDKYQYFLEYDGTRVTNTSQMLEQLVGAHKRDAEFHLIEQITPGALPR
jgi:hypothetical protein